MDQFFALLSQLLQQIPTQPLLRLAQVLILLGAFFVARRCAQSGGSLRSFFWVFMLLGSLIFIAVADFLSWSPFRLIPLLSVYPLGMVMLNLLWLGWIGAFPFPVRSKSANSLSILFFVILHLAIAVLMVFDTYAGVLGLPGTQWMAANGSQVWTWSAAAILMLWIFSALLRRPRGWFSGLVIAALLFVGLFAEKTIHPASIAFSGIFLLFQTLAYALIPVMLVHQTPVSGGQTSPDEASLEKLRAANLNLRQESSASPADSASLPGQLARDLARQEAQEQLDRLQSDNLRLKNLLNQGGYTAALQLEEELRQSLGESLILRQSLVTADNRILELEQDSRRMEREQNQLRTIFHNSAGAFQAPLNDITILTGQLLDSLTAEDPNLDGDKLRAIQDKARDLKIQTEQLQRSSEPVPERVSVSEMALKLAAGLVSVREEKELHWQMRVSEGLPNLLTIRDQLEKVLERLLSHAAAVTPQGGTIGLSAWQEAGNILLSVHEEGQGYSSEDLARLFEPRLENAEEWDPAVIRADVYALQGDLTVESVPGKNAVYTIRLPLQV